METLLQNVTEAYQLIKNEQAEEALGVIKTSLESFDSAPLWRKLAHCYLILGDEVIAKAILRATWRRFEDPHVLELIAAGVAWGKPHVVDQWKLLYFSVPKCGSSTLKDALLVGMGKPAVGELSHSQTSHIAKPVQFSALKNTYKDYCTIAVVRSPELRLRSYWKKNITEANSLVNEAGGRKNYYGLNTKPTYLEVLKNFARYRCVFLDFRHHTDPIDGFLGKKPDKFTHIFDMSRVQEACSLISNRSGISIEHIENMKSKKQNDVSQSELQLEQDLIKTFYRTEVSLFRKFY